MANRYIIEKCTNKRGMLEIWKRNRKGFYNFIGYISAEELDTFKEQHKKDDIVNRTNL